MYRLEWSLQWLERVLSSLSDIGVTEDMIDDIVNGTLIMDGGYTTLTEKEIRELLNISVYKKGI